MKTLLLFVAVLWIINASDAQIHESKRQQIGNCVKEAGWTKDDWIKSCTSDIPTDETSLSTFKGWVTCMMTALDILQGSDSDEKIKIGGGSNLASLDRSPEVIESMKKCAKIANQASTGSDAAMEYYACFQKSEKEAFIAGCQAGATSF